MDFFDAGAGQVLGRQRAHRAGAHHHRGAPGKTVQLLVGHAQCDRDDRRAGRINAGFGVHAFARRQGTLCQLVQHASRGVVGLGGGVGAPDLSEYLLLADDGGVQAACHGEQVLDGRLRVADVGVLGQIVQRHAGVLGEHLAYHRQPAVERVDDGVHLDAVAGRQDHRLGDQGRLQHRVDDLRLIGFVRAAELFEHGDRRAAMRHPEKQHAHG